MLKQCSVDSHLLKMPRNMWQGRLYVKSSPWDAAAQWDGESIIFPQSHFAISHKVFLCDFPLCCDCNMRPASLTKTLEQGRGQLALC